MRRLATHVVATPQYVRDKVVVVVIVVGTPAAQAMSSVARNQDRRNDFADRKMPPKFLDAVEFDSIADER